MVKESVDLDQEMPLVSRETRSSPRSSYFTTTGAHTGKCTNANHNNTKKKLKKSLVLYIYI